MINYNVDSDGIATITWDMPGRSMNVLNEASLTAYTGALEEAIKDDKVKGIILTSAKADFIAGADLEMLLGTDTSDAAKLMEQFSQLQKIFRRQETGGKPIVAAINGTALGGGFEICLACHYRIAAANPKAKVGQDRKSTRLNSSHTVISYAVFCLKKKKKNKKKNNSKNKKKKRIKKKE